MNRIAIEAKGDFLERLSSATPIRAIAELVWNGLDAGAGRVSVRLETNGLGGIEAIRVVDDGFGINHAHLQPLFGGLGDSWKRQKSRLNGRALHGKTGQGRFKAFSLGHQVEWRTVFDSPEGRMRYQVVGRAEALTGIEYSDPVPAGNDPTGTEVVITGIRDGLGTLLRENARTDLAKLFAEYLSQYPGIQLDYDGVRIDPTELQLDRQEIPLGEIPRAGGGTIQAVLTLVEWPMKAERVLHLCDAGGFSLHETDPGQNVRAPGHEFTAYLKSELFRELESTGALALEELHPDAAAVVHAAREAIREHFRRRVEEHRSRIVDRWREQGIYPFEMRTEIDPVETAWRQVFDVVAVNVEASLPVLESADSGARRLVFRLLADAVRQGAAGLGRVLTETLHLRRDDADVLSGLLADAATSEVLRADAEVAARLALLAELEGVVNDPEKAKRRASREQVRRLLEGASWLFGDEFAWSVADPEVGSGAGGEDPGEGSPGDESASVGKPGSAGNAGRGELKVARVALVRPGETVRLVVEVRRPSQPITVRVLNRVAATAAGLAGAARSNSGLVRWRFVVVGDGLDDGARARVTSEARRPGLVSEEAESGVEIWAYGWSELIAAARARLEATRSALREAAGRELAKGHVQQAHMKFIPAAGQR